MIKRIISAFLLLVLCLGLCACGSTDTPSADEKLAAHYQEEMIKLIDKYESGIIDAEAAEKAIDELSLEWVTKSDVVSLYLQMKTLRTEFYMITSHPEDKEDTEKAIFKTKELMKEMYDFG